MRFVSKKAVRQLFENLSFMVEVEEVTYHRRSPKCYILGEKTQHTKESVIPLDLYTVYIAPTNKWYGVYHLGQASCWIKEDCINAI